MTGPRVMAVVVTHNRRELLARCLGAIATQSRPPELTVVVDNGSTDGTADLLATLPVRHVRQANLGSAGGWHRGIAEAMSLEAEWVWLMDDDGYPAPDALERLLEASGPSDACLNALVVCEQAPDRLVFPMPTVRRDGLPAFPGLAAKHRTVEAVSRRATDGRYPFAHLFNGTLVRVATARRVGNVETAYFIFGDELDYLFRLRGQGRVSTVVAARHLHPDVGARPLTLPKVFYYVRNTVVLARRYLGAPRRRALVAVLATLLRVGRRNGLGMLARITVGARRGLLWRAVRDGLADRLGVVEL